MPIQEVFPNPTVKQVIFQVRFPSLFYIESKIGELQLKLMEAFPTTSLTFRRQLLIADVDPQVSPEGFPINLEKEGTNKIWRFESQDNVQLNVLASSLDISSRYHKTYNLGAGPKFRDTIQLVLDSFIEVTSLPVFSRIGLRYVDECPVPAMENAAFSEWYNTAFPLEKFGLPETHELLFSALVRRDNHFVRYVEKLDNTGTAPRLIMDFDSYAENVRSQDYLAIADTLHDTISAEYERTIKEPVYEFMRQGG